MSLTCIAPFYFLLFDYSTIKRKNRRLDTASIYIQKNFGLLFSALTKNNVVKLLFVVKFCFKMYQLPYTIAKKSTIQKKKNVCFSFCINEGYEILLT